MTEGCAPLECHPRNGRARSVKYSGARPARQLLVMELSLKWTRNRIGSQWRSRRIADEIGSYLPILRINRAAELRTDWRQSRRYIRACPIEEAVCKIDACADESMDQGLDGSLCK